MSRFSVAVITDENTTVEELLEPYGPKCYTQKEVLKKKNMIIVEEQTKIMKHISTMQKMLEYQEKLNVNKPAMTRLKNSIKYLENLLEQSDEEIYKIATKKYCKDLLNENGDLLDDRNPYRKWIYYNKNSEYTKFIVVKNPENPKEYIYTNTAKIKDIEWELLDHKAIFTDASLFPDGTWYDEQLGIITKIYKKENQIEYKTMDAKNSIIPHDEKMQITIVEYFV